MAISFTRRLLTYFGGMRVNLLRTSMSATPDEGFIRQHEAFGGVLIAPVSVTTLATNSFATWTVRAAGPLSSAALITIGGTGTSPGSPTVVAWGR